MKKYPVIAECVDQRDGTRYFPGDKFPDPTPEQAERLIAAGCLAAPKASSSTAGTGTKPVASTDELKLKNGTQLKKIAQAEKIDLGDASTPAAMRDVIRAARAKDA